jgi:hypothetical protein
MILPHHQIDLPRPLAVQLVKTGGLVAVRVGPPVFFPQQHLRDALAAKLLVDVRPVRQRASITRRRRPGEQQPVQHRVVQRLGQRPRQIGRPRPGDVTRHCSVRYPKAAFDLAQFQSGAKHQTKHFADLSHGQSPVRHMPPPRMNESMECGTGDNEVVPRRARPTGGVIPWSVCVGIAGQFGVESVVSLLRNTQFTVGNTTSSGINPILLESN